MGETIKESIEKISELSPEEFAKMYSNKNTTSLRSAVIDLLQDESDLSSEQSKYAHYIKDRIIADEIINLNNEDILSDIKLVEENTPEGLTPLETVRWLYINLGKLFSYDYRVANDPKYGYGKLVDTSEFVGRYQTCVQISQVMEEELNKIPGVQCRIISRKLNNARGQYGEDHVANEVIINDNDYELKLLLDLTLDLYLIQSDCYTLHFGYEDDGTGTYDIISQNENKQMDIKLGFSIDEEDYTNDRIEKVKRLLAQTDFTGKSPKDVIDYRVTLINRLKKRFPGYHEGKQYVNMLFSEFIVGSYREFNLFYHDDGLVNLKTIYRLEYDGYEKWIIYSNRSGFISTDRKQLKEMLNSGWKTNSNSLIDIIYGPDENKKSLK